MRNVQTGKWHYALLVGMGLVLMSTGSVAPGQQPQQPSQGPLNVYHIPPAAQEFPAESEPGEAETLHLLVGQSLVVNSPEPIKRLSAAQPGIIDAVEQNSNQVQISGKAPGAVSLVVWDEMGQSQEFNVYVDSADRSSMEQLSPAAPYAP